MKTVPFLLLLVTAVGLPAQTSPEAKAQSDTLKLRGDMAESVGRGTEKSDAALARLKKEKSPTGLKLDADADFAFAAIDIGRRLIAAGQPGEAEKFFKEAEKSLDTLVKKTPDTQAATKADYLKKLSLLRSDYLNKVDQAKRDIAQAVALRPDDRHLKRAKDTLANAHADAGKTPKKE